MHDHYVVITNSSFLGDLLDDGDIWACPEVTAKWVVDLGFGFYADSAGDAAVAPWGTSVDVPTPVLQSAHVTDAAPTLVVMDFSGCVQVTDISGITVEVDSVAASQEGVAAVDDQLTVTLSSAVANGEVVTFTYNDIPGNVVACGEGNAATASVTEYPVTNEVAA